MTKLSNIAFFGGEPLGLPALQALCTAGYTPSLVLCNPDRPSGRGQLLQAPPIKDWAHEHRIEVFQPTSYKSQEDLERLTSQEWDLFVVVAYNFILPKWLLELPKYGVINVHPSLLPKLRGASPIRTAILHNLRDEVGVSIMVMDEEMDHGPLLLQAPLEPLEWPISGPVLDDTLAVMGGKMLVTAITGLLEGTITPTEQDHSAATYTKKFKKADAEIKLDPLAPPAGTEAFETLCKINAFAGMSDCFFVDNGTRVKIKAATIVDDRLTILRVTPEGRKEMDFTAYVTSR